MAYNHLSIEERDKIQELLWQKKSIRYIAKELGRSPSSIGREINKNNSQLKTTYTPRLAHTRALKKRSSRGLSKLDEDEVLRSYVITHLKLGWSPGQIAATASRNISHEAIYQYVYAQVYRNGHGEVKPNKEDLRPFLARRKKRRTPQGLRKSQRILKGSLPSIDDRPISVDLRTDIGHWEDDLIVSRESADKLKTINERVSGLVFISRVSNGTAEVGDMTVTRRLKAVPKQFRKTLTRDRGSENIKYEKLSEELDIQVFFAHPYSSFERGSNENLNGLIRRFFPKKTNFQLVTDAEIKKVEYLLNSRPRKRLGWKTPYQVFYEMTGVALGV